MAAGLGFLFLLVLGIFRATGGESPGGDVVSWTLVAAAGLAWALAMWSFIRRVRQRIDEAATSDRPPGDQYRWR